MVWDEAISETKRESKRWEGMKRFSKRRYFSDTHFLSVIQQLLHFMTIIDNPLTNALFGLFLRSSNGLNISTSTINILPYFESFVKSFCLATSGKTGFSGVSQTRHSCGDFEGVRGESSGLAGCPFRRQPVLIPCSNGLLVNLIVLLRSDDLQIAGSIVSSVPIPVMDILIRPERSAEHGFRNHPMLELPVHAPIRSAPFLASVQLAIAESVPEGLPLRRCTPARLTAIPLLVRPTPKTLSANTCFQNSFHF